MRERAHYDNIVGMLRFIAKLERAGSIDFTIMRPCVSIRSPDSHQQHSGAAGSDQQLILNAFRTLHRLRQNMSLQKYRYQ